MPPLPHLLLALALITFLLHASPLTLNAEIFDTVSFYETVTTKGQKLQVYFNTIDVPELVLIVQVIAETGEILHTTQGSTDNFAVHDLPLGDVQVKFTHPDNVYKAQMFELSMHIPHVAKPATKVLDFVAPIEGTLDQLADTLQEILRNQRFYRQRQRRNYETVDAIEKMNFGLSVLCVVVMVVTGFVQYWSITSSLSSKNRIKG